MLRVFLGSYRSIDSQEFEVGPFTVLFGKNNTGKTNLLEAIYGVLAPGDLPGGETPVRGLRGQSDRIGPFDMATVGAVYVVLENGLAFDEEILAMVPDSAPVEYGVLRFSELPPGQVCFASTDRGSEVWFTDVAEYIQQSDADWSIIMPVVDDNEPQSYEIDEESRSGDGPRPRPLFLGWEFGDVDQLVTSTIARLTGKFPNLGSSFDGIGQQFLEPVDNDEPVTMWRLRPEVRYSANRLATLANELLPDFLDGLIEVELDVPTNWEGPKVRLTYRERGGEGHPLNDLGRGASRWSAIAVQVALRLMQDHPQLVSLGDPEESLSEQVLFIDEPEAHLHPSAVASVVRWCQRMVGRGFHVIAASHHEEFLRVPSDEVTFVKVSREVTSWEDQGERHSYISTRARSIPTADTSTLQELADEVGLHPAAALALRRAIVFVEGTLDEAVLDEFAGARLDAAGITIIPIHGTKNLEGLIDGEFTTRLGIKAGVLTDNTSTDTIWDRSNRKRSSEEVKLVRLIKRFHDQGLPPPDLFGVPEDDLLFALPAEGIREYLKGPFPGWQELREECRTAEGRGPSDSVDWKTYALNQYGLQITTPSGVRSIVRALDLAGVELPSIRAVVDDIIDWAVQERNR